MVEISPPKAPIAPPIPTKRAVPFKSLFVILAHHTLSVQRSGLLLSSAQCSQSYYLFHILLIFSINTKTYLLLEDPPPPPEERVEPPPPPEE